MLWRRVFYSSLIENSMIREMLSSLGRAGPPGPQPAPWPAPSFTSKSETGARGPRADYSRFSGLTEITSFPHPSPASTVGKFQIVAKVIFRYRSLYRFLLRKPT